MRKTVLALSLAATIFTGCSKDDDVEVHDVVEATTEREIQLRKAFEQFGLNRAEYDDTVTYAITGGNLAILATLRKSDQKLVVLAHDSISNRRIIQDSSYKLSKRIITTYYETTEECTLNYLLPCIIRVENGFIAFVDAFYKGDKIATTKTFGFFIDGTSLTSKEVEYKIHDPANLFKWYRNSCLVVSFSERKALCVNTEGEIKATFDEAIDREKAFPLSYTDYVYYDKGSDGIIDLYMKKGSEEVWRTGLELPNKPTSTAKISLYYLNLENNFLNIKIHVVEMDGTTHDYNFKVDVTNGQYFKVSD